MFSSMKRPVRLFFGIIGEQGFRLVIRRCETHKASGQASMGLGSTPDLYETRLLQTARSSTL